MYSQTIRTLTDRYWFVNDNDNIVPDRVTVCELNLKITIRRKYERLLDIPENIIAFVNESEFTLCH